MNSVAPFSGADTLWVVHIGNSDPIALRALNEGFVCIGWTEIGDLSPYDSRPKMRAAMESVYPNWKPKKVNSSYGQPYRFAHVMRVNDPIIFPIGPTGEIAIGLITGPCRWADDPDLVANGYNNVRLVEWLKIVPRTAFSQAALHSFGSFLTISTSDDYLEEVHAVLEGGTISGSGSSPVAGRMAYRTGTWRSVPERLTRPERPTYRDQPQLGHYPFEEVVGAVFEALGYTATVTQASGDHGVDVIAHPDPLGLERPFIKVQVKSGTGSVGEPEVNQLRGLLNSGEQGVLVSLGKFTSGAQAVARGSSNLTLIGPKRFVRLFLDHYDKVAPEWRAKFPLKQAFVPFG